MPLIADCTFLNNATIILDCLASTDLQTARRLHEDIIHLDGGVNYRKIDSVATLLSVFAVLKKDCKNGMLPIIHIEAHGHSAHGIQIGDNKDILSWKELVSHLREINILTKNNTGVILAACEGLHAILQVRIFLPTPFFFLIASPDKIPAGDFDKYMVQFYGTLSNSGSVISAMEKLPGYMQMFHSEKFFTVAIGKHFKQYMGKRFLPNVEKMVSRGHNIRNSPDINGLRGTLKIDLKPSKDRFFRYASRFLHGKVSITYEEFIDFLRNKKRM